MMPAGGHHNAPARGVTPAAVAAADDHDDDDDDHGKGGEKAGWLARLFGWFGGKDDHDGDGDDHDEGRRRPRRGTATRRPSQRPDGSTNEVEQPGPRMPSTSPRRIATASSASLITGPAARAAGSSSRSASSPPPTPRRRPSRGPRTLAPAPLAPALEDFVACTSARSSSRTAQRAWGLRHRRQIQGPGRRQTPAQDRRAGLRADR